MKLKINEVIEDVRAELLCYEEGEAVVDSWEKEFREWIEKNKGKHKDIVADKNGVFLKIKDEEEIWRRLRRVLFRNIGKNFEGNTDFLRFF